MVTCPGPSHTISKFGLDLQISPVQQNKMESVDKLRRALEAARAETAALRAAAEGADRAPRGNESGDAGEAASAYRATYDGGYSDTRAADTRANGHAGANGRQGANPASCFWGGKNRPVPKFPRSEDEAAM